MHNILSTQNIKSLVLGSILIFLVIINVVYFYLNLNLNIISNGYAFNELFINYQAGFVRRGLLGEIFWIFNNTFSITPITFFSYLFFLLYLSQIYLFYKLFKKYLTSNFILILIFLSPSLILFNIYDPNVYFIKDIFVKLSILLHAYLLSIFLDKKDDIDNYFSTLKILIIPLLIVIILIHEYQVVFLGVHYLFSLSVAKNKKNVFKITRIYSILLIPIVLVLIFFGDQIHFDNLNQILSKFNVEVHPQLAGARFYHNLGAFYKWHFFYFSYRDFLNLFFSIILGLLIFYAIFQYLIEKQILKFHSEYQKKYLIYFAPILLAIILTTDHGRNISFISFHLVAFYSILPFDRNKFHFLKNKINKIFLLKMFSILFLFFYIFMWKLDQMAGFGLRGIPNDIFQSSLFAEVLKFIKFANDFIDLNVVDLPEINL